MRKLFLIILLFFSPAFAKVIITYPKNNDFVNKGLINIKGVSDEACVDLSIYDLSSNKSFNYGSVVPDDNYFWNLTINVSQVIGPDVYLIASTILDKNNVQIKLRSSLSLDLQVSESFDRCNKVIVTGTIINSTGPANINGSPLSFNDSINVFTSPILLVGDHYEASYYLPNNARLGYWSVFINHTDFLFDLISDKEFFSVKPAEVLIKPLSDYVLSKGYHLISVNASYIDGSFFDGGVSVIVTNPSGDSITSLLGKCGSFFCNEFFFNESGKWFFNFSAEGYGNAGSFSNNYIISDELIVEVINSSLMVGDETSFLVKVIGSQGIVDNVSFTISGLPASISRVTRDGDYFKVFLDISLIPGVYNFLIVANDDFNNTGSSNCLIKINDLVLNSCINSVCTDSSGIINRGIVNFINGSIKLTDGSIINTSVELYVSGRLVDSTLPNNLGLFSFDTNLLPDSFLLVVARYGELVKSNLFSIIDDIEETKFSELIIDMPSVVSVNNSVTNLTVKLINRGSSVNVSFISTLPSWLSIKDSVLMPANSSISIPLLISPINVSSGVYSLSLNGFAGTNYFSKSFVIIVEKTFLNNFEGNLSVDSFSFDLGEGGFIIQVSNSDMLNHDLLINYSGNLIPLSVSAFNQTELFIPFSNQTSDLSVISGDAVMLNVDSNAINQITNNSSIEVAYKTEPLNVLLILGYPLIIGLYLFRKLIKK